MIDQRLKRLDEKLGADGEKKVKEYLKKLYPKEKGYKVRQFKWKYNPFDFCIYKGDKPIHEYEIKTRTCGIKTFNSLMFGKNKLTYLLNKKKVNKELNFTFLWLLKDDHIYGWDYIEDKEQYKDGYGGNFKRGDEAKKCVFVNTEYISKVF